MTSQSSRRTFLKCAAFGGAVLPASLQAAVDNTEPMKITRIDAVTFRKGLRIGGGSGGSEDAEFWCVRLHTDKGIWRQRLRPGREQRVGPEL